MLYEPCIVVRWAPGGFGSNDEGVDASVHADWAASGAGEAATARTSRAKPAPRTRAAREWVFEDGFIGLRGFLLEQSPHSD